MRLSDKISEMTEGRLRPCPFPRASPFGQRSGPKGEVPKPSGETEGVHPSPLLPPFRAKGDQRGKCPRRGQRGFTAIFNFTF